MSADDCELSADKRVCIMIQVHQLRISLISNSSRVKLSFKASAMSFSMFASKKLNHVFNTCFVNEIRYEKTPSGVSRFLINAEQAGKPSLHMSAYCFKYFRCVSIKFSLIVLKFSMYTPVDLVYFFLKKRKYAANLHL